MGHWKGGVGEREVIGLLCPWWRRLEPTFQLYRTPGSGGWAKTRKVPPGFRGAGDLMYDPETCATHVFPFSVEVKWRKKVSEISIQNFCDGKPSPVWSYWDQCVESSNQDRKIPMLWVRGQNVRGKRMPWRIAIETRSGMVLYLAREFLELDPFSFLHR